MVKVTILKKEKTMLAFQILLQCNKLNVGYRYDLKISVW